MPTELEKQRGVEEYRTIDLPGGKYKHVAITKKAGPHGGHTIAGPTYKKKSMYASSPHDHEGPCLLSGLDSYSVKTAKQTKDMKCDICGVSLSKHAKASERHPFRPPLEL